MNVDSELNDFDGKCRLFPLPGVVLYPHVVITLHIFEPRYRQMVEDALATDGLICMVQSDSAIADELRLEEPPLLEVGGLGRVIAHEKLPDGRYNLLLMGLKRVRLLKELEVDTLYRQAAVEVMKEEEEVVQGSQKQEELKSLFAQLLQESGAIDQDTQQLLKTEGSLAMLTDLVAHTLGLAPGVKQALLEECKVEKRLEYLLGILRQVVSRPRANEGKHRFPPRFSDN